MGMAKHKVDDCVNSRRMVLATHDAYDHGLTQIVWFGQTVCMVVATHEAYDHCLTQVV
jgi:hypothetical protein